MLSTVEKRKLQAALDGTTSAVLAAKNAWETGEFSVAHFGTLQWAQSELAQYLAHYEDRRLGLSNETIGLMRVYEQIASDLIHTVQVLNTPERVEECIKSPVTGHWAISRRLLLQCGAYQHAVVCNNPAVGRAELERWEASLRAQIPLMKDAA